MLRRRSLAALRREIESVAPAVLARFLPSWHGVGGKASGVRSSARGRVPAAGLALPATVIERDVIAGRRRQLQPAPTGRAVSMGEVVWVGRGALGATDGRVAL